MLFEVTESAFSNTVIALAALLSAENKLDISAKDMHAVCLFSGGSDRRCNVGHNTLCCGAHSLEHMAPVTSSGSEKSGERSKLTPDFQNIRGKAIAGISREVRVLHKLRQAPCTPVHDHLAIVNILRAWVEKQRARLAQRFENVRYRLIRAGA